MSKVLAKFIVTEITEYPIYTDGVDDTGKRIKLNAVKGEPFGKYTPNGSIDMFILNSEASKHFHVGKEYFVTFSEDIGLGSE